MKITDFSPVNKAKAATKKKDSSSVGGGDFLGLLSTNETETTTPPSAMQEMPQVNSLDGLLSLQELPEDELRKRKAVVEDGEETIEALETLRHALLTGTVPEHLLQTLGKVVAAQKQQVNDPRLMSIIEDIELRAAVELAKLERASQPG
jgi:hypothetical protein